MTMEITEKITITTFFAHIKQLPTDLRTIIENDMGMRSELIYTVEMINLAQKSTYTGTKRVQDITRFEKFFINVVRIGSSLRKNC
jgi:hypothetical protein